MSHIIIYKKIIPFSEKNVTKLRFRETKFPTGSLVVTHILLPLHFALLFLGDL